MAQGFKSLAGVFDPTLRLPLVGRDGTEVEYAVPPADAATGLWAQHAFTLGLQANAAPETITPEDVAGLALDDDEERDLFKRLLGPAFGQMVDNGVSWEGIKLAGTTALINAATNRKQAEDYWNTGGAPGEAQGNRADRRSAAAPSTPRLASVSGTPPRKPRKRAAKKG